MSVHGSQVAEAGGAPPRAAIAGAGVCAGVALLLVVATALVTFGLSDGYGFGPWWDWSAFVMTGGAAVLTGAALLGASRLARLRLRPLPVLVASVVSVFAFGYVAGVLGDALHH